MRSRARALDALALTLGLWVGGRLLVHLVPLRDLREAHQSPQARQTLMSPALLVGRHLSIAPPVRTSATPAHGPSPHAPAKITHAELTALPAVAKAAACPTPTRAVPPPEAAKRDLLASPLPSSPQSQTGIQGAAWGLLRGSSDARAIAEHGQLGGSQIGARILLPLTHIEPGLSASLRFSSSPDAPSSHELALGLNLARPFGLPLSLLMEQRFGAGQGGAGRPAVVLVGGLADKRPLPRLVAEGYGQIGGVGLTHPKGFADGRFTLTLQTRPSRQAPRIGVGLWAAAQPGAARLDIGPSLVLPDDRVRITFEWRLRVAGQAAPASGPSLTMGKDF